MKWHAFWIVLGVLEAAMIAYGGSAVGWLYAALLGAGWAAMIGAYAVTVMPRGWLRIGALALIVLVFFSASAWPSLRIFYINARAGCWPWSPKMVEYHRGMTLCPGQSAMGTIMLPLISRPGPKLPPLPPIPSTLPPGVRI